VKRLEQHFSGSEKLIRCCEKMREMSAGEASRKFSEVLDAAEDGETIVGGAGATALP
jgi:hypothetical protein